MRYEDEKISFPLKNSNFVYSIGFRRSFTRDDDIREAVSLLFPRSPYLFEYLSTTVKALS